MPNAVERMLADNLEDFRGAVISGTAPITEHLINSALNDQVSKRGSTIQQWDIRVFDDNRVQLGLKVVVGPFVKWFRPEVVIHPQALWENSPVVIFRITSFHYGAISRLAAWVGGLVPGGIRIKDDRVAVDFATFPALAKYRHLFQHLKLLEMSTRSGVIYTTFQLKVE